MRILIANGLDYAGGAEGWIVHAAGGLAARGHAVTVTHDPASPLAASLATAGVTAVPLRLSAAGSVAGLARILRRDRYDVAVSTVRREHVKVGTAARMAGLPGGVARLLTGWTPSVRPSTRRRLRRGWKHRRCVHLAATNSEAGRSEAIERGLVAEDRVVTIHNGVDLERFDPDRLPRARFRSELGIPGDAFLIASISRFVERKGQAVELEALGRLVASRPDVHLVFVGPCRTEERPFLRSLRRRAADFPGAGRIRFLGGRDDVPRILADSDLLVRAALEEGLPNIVLEAMAMRVPVVATRICGTPEAVLDGRTGSLVAAGDAEGLLRAADELVRAPVHRRRAMGEEARARVRREFRMDRMVEAYERLFERACGGRSLA